MPGRGWWGEEEPRPGTCTERHDYGGRGGSAFRYKTKRVRKNTPILWNGPLNAPSFLYSNFQYNEACVNKSKG